MKKGLLRTLSALMAVSMLLCMSMVAFADGQAYNVKTTYDGTNVTVTTSVSGVVPSEQVAFLVEKTVGDSTEIIWIDQQTAKGDYTAESIFTAAEDDAVGAKVKVGTTSYAASTFGTEKEIALPSHTVTWDVKGAVEDEVEFDTKSDVVAVVDGEEVSSGAKTSYKVTFYFSIPAGEELVSIAYDGTTVNNFIGNAWSCENVSKDTHFDFTFAAKEAASANASVTESPSGAITSSVVEGVKTASVTATALDAVEFGILVAVKPGDGEESALDKVTTLEGLSTKSVPVRKYHAMGANAAGQFVIELKDTNGVFFVEGVEYEACVYAMGSTLAKGAKFDLN